jgi:hypothetical protein
MHDVTDTGTYRAADHGTTGDASTSDNGADCTNTGTDGGTT